MIPVVRAVLAVLAASTAVALLAAPAAETAPAAKAKSPWQLFPGAKMDVSRPVLALGWAANRVWVVTPTNDVPMLHSARVSGGKLAGFARTRVPTDAGTAIPIVDGQLVLQKAGTTASHEYTLAATTLPLLTGGGLGGSRAVADDLLARAKEAIPKLWSAGIVNGVGAGSRVVWALEGSPDCHSIGGCPGFFLACCAENGAAADLTRFVDRRENLLRYTLHLGRDSHGRIWLAWLDNRDYRHAAQGYPRVLELDGSTLRPLLQAAAIPGVVRRPDRPRVRELVPGRCPNLCRGHRLVGAGRALPDPGRQPLGARQVRRRPHVAPRRRVPVRPPPRRVLG
jgi:hypothetical protein